MSAHIKKQPAFRKWKAGCCSVCVGKASFDAERCADVGADAGWHGAFVEADGGVVDAGGAAWHLGAEGHHGEGEDFFEIAEILAPAEGLGVGRGGDARRVLGEGGEDAVVQRAVVDDRGHAGDEARFGAAAEEGREIFAERDDARFQLVAQAVVVGAQGAAKLGVGGHDVVGGAGCDGADGKHCGFKGGRFAADEPLQGVVDLHGAEDGIVAGVGRCAVGAGAVHAGDEFVGGCVERSVGLVEHAAFQHWRHMEREGAAVVGADDAVLQNVEGAGGAFFVGLEEDAGAVGERAFVALEQNGGAEEHGCVEIVAAVVRPGGLCGKLFAAFFLHGQGVGVGAQDEPCGAVADLADDGAGRWFCKSDAVLGEHGADEIKGLWQIVAAFGVAMERTTPIDERWLERQRFFVDVHLSGLLAEEEIGENDHAKNDAVIAEDLEVVLGDVGDEELDGEDRHEESDDHAEKQDAGFVGCEAEAKLDEL